jgi:hypothetical protein
LLPEEDIGSTFIMKPFEKNKNGASIPVPLEKIKAQ